MAMTPSQFQEKLVNLQENMMSFALSLTSNYEEAEDLTQETSLKALDNQDKFVGDTNFKGWVLTIMKHLFINNYRRMARQHVQFDDSVDLYNLPLESRSDSGSPEHFLYLQQIDNQIDRLNDDLKTPFSMHITGFKYSEIAEVLGLPLGTVKSRIFFARNQLQKQLKDFA